MMLLNCWIILLNLLLLNPIPIFLSCPLYSWKKSTWKEHFSDFLASWVLVASVNGKAFAKTGWREKRKQKSFFLFLVLALKQWETEGKYCFLYKQQQANWRWLEIPATSKGSTSSWLLLGCSNNGPTAVVVFRQSHLQEHPRGHPFPSLVLPIPWWPISYIKVSLLEKSRVIYIFLSRCWLIHHIKNCFPSRLLVIRSSEFFLL